jgi:SAM-dependent methyltransferase
LRVTDEIWLRAMWPAVSAGLPAPPARVLEIGCGPLGGFVPFLRDAGQQPLGVDPEAPAGPEYRQARFEDTDVGVGVEAVIASASLHHVADLDEVLQKIATVLRPGGRLIVFEWSWERLDEATAQWCFARLGQEESWLHRHREQWRQSGESWESYLASWAAEEGLHSGADVLTAIERRFRTESLTDEVYLFSELEPPDPSVERAAIEAGEIRATGIRYVGSVA